MTNILIVDDEEEILSYIEIELSEVYGDGIVIDKALNGDEACQLVAKKSYDLIITDLKMPKVDGLEFIQIVKNMENFAPVPFIVFSAFLPKVSANTDPATLDDVYFLEKPGDPEKFHRLLKLIKHQKNIA